MSIDITFDLNEEPVSLAVEPRELLGHVLRERLGVRGTHVACGQGICGACTVLINGEAMRSCLLLGVQANGCQIRTISGVADVAGSPHPLQEALKDTGAVQCGYCTAGIVLSALSYLEECPAPSRTEIEHALSGNICRCTGYTAIVDAIERYVAQSWSAPQHILETP